MFGAREFVKNRLGDYVEKEVNEKFPIPKGRNRERLHPLGFLSAGNDKLSRVLRSAWRKINAWADRKQSERENRWASEWDRRIRAEGDAPWLRSI